MVKNGKYNLDGNSKIGGDMKFIDCQGGFVKFHSPPEKGKAINDTKFGSGAVRQRAWTAFHPPPLCRNRG
tara:strand:- start:245 stop:454 length:210 start_codon:yes stop_codon:yes gene_type:complete